MLAIIILHTSFANLMQLVLQFDVIYIEIQITVIRVFFESQGMITQWLNSQYWKQVYFAVWCVIKGIPNMKEFKELKTNIKVGFMDQIVLTLCNLIMKLIEMKLNKYVSLMKLNIFSAEYDSECHAKYHDLFYNIIDTILKNFSKFDPRAHVVLQTIRFFLNLMVIVQVNDGFGRYCEVFFESILDKLSNCKGNQSQSLRDCSMEYISSMGQSVADIRFSQDAHKLMKVLLPLCTQLERNDDNSTMVSLNSIVNGKGFDENVKWN